MGSVTSEDAKQISIADPKIQMLKIIFRNVINDNGDGVGGHMCDGWYVGDNNGDKVHINTHTSDDNATTTANAPTNNDDDGIIYAR